MLLNDTDLTQVNFDDLQIYNGQLYAGTASFTAAGNEVGAGLPTTGGQPLGVCPAFRKARPITRFSSRHSIPPPTARSPTRCTWSATRPACRQGRFKNTRRQHSMRNWRSHGLGQHGAVTACAVRGLTGYVNGSNVVMYASTGADHQRQRLHLHVHRYQRLQRHDVGLASTTIVASTPNNEAFRGIALRTNRAPTLNGSSADAGRHQRRRVAGEQSGPTVSQLIASLGANAVATRPARQRELPLPRRTIQTARGSTA